MSKAKLQYLASKASDAYLDDGESLNDAVTKIAKENKLNPDELSRVCELANLKTFDSAVKKAASNKVQFELADVKQIRKNLNMTDKPRTKTAASNALAMEYNLSPEFLSTFSKQASAIDITPLELREFEANLPFKKARKLNDAIKTKLAMKKLLRKQEAGKIGLKIKIASEHAEAVKMIKTAALRKVANPFTQWPLINKAHPELKEVTDSVFTKAANELVSTWQVNIKDLLSGAKKEAAEALDKDWDSLGKDGTSIVKKLDTISAYHDLYKKVQESHLKTNSSLELTQSPLDTPKTKETINNTNKIKLK